MLETEFNERTGMSPTPEEFSVINDLYINHQGDKDEFCAKWKKTPEDMRSAIVKLVNEARASIEAVNNELKDSKEYADTRIRESKEDFGKYVKFVRETAVKLLDNDPDDEVAYKLVPIHDIVLYKARMNQEMNSKDIEFMMEKFSK